MVTHSSLVLKFRQQKKTNISAGTLDTDSRVMVKSIQTVKQTCCINWQKFRVHVKHQYLIQLCIEVAANEEEDLAQSARSFAWQLIQF